MVQVYMLLYDVVDSFQQDCGKKNKHAVTTEKVTQILDTIVDTTMD
ncbi:MAG: hypothetical protein G01um101448_479 [Parcubacteria group bacterium Gr01-1014_48]|nr:MAG: hypothetical protein Greene041614_693 [Parcubacteria group bacterium Greene0416_14]TSC73870.1 MAG: hypothetical protein G01um101448_479 [Parcubacteria group bacterium Gr01-1014_48]TSD01567.1 MAG: hypothetical protein Greene101415_147 [Parcubacteria group bacterium Greene1014_15]TSD08133.1 MAG: hypothetical protein Greene07144_368 [Parcubacteria group bacterium Greene0714_4]